MSDVVVPLPTLNLMALMATSGCTPIASSIEDALKA